ncbi:MAG: 4-hydroxy-tetrahydrodipicolinate reductase [Planctomycetota bacterium]|jgi:4-hydroxy-tetrahydrodipicolinate reductase
MILGARGRVGQCLVRGVEEADDLLLAGAVDLDDDLESAIAAEQPVVAIDFTTPDAVFANVSVLLRHRVHAVVGTTGMSEEQLGQLDALAAEHGVGCLVAPNFALGAVLMMRFAEEAARHLPWVEVIERHHEHKLDAPSGTATTTAQRIARARSEAPTPAKETEIAPGARGGRVDGVSVHSVRLPGSVAHQEVLFGGPGETLSIRHDTINREVFVPGVLLAVRGIADHAGLVRGLEPLLWPEA